MKSPAYRTVYNKNGSLYACITEQLRAINWKNERLFVKVEDGKIIIEKVEV